MRLLRLPGNLAGAAISIAGRCEAAGYLEDGGEVEPRRMTVEKHHLAVGVTSAELWVAGPASPAVKLAAQSIYLNIIGLASYAGKAVLLTFEDDNSVYVRIQTT